MKFIVVGSGLIGVTTGYFLRRRGHEVTVIERQPSAGLETSFANAALLTPGLSNPWNAPGCWRALLTSLARSDAPLQLRLGKLPSLAGWGIAFLRNSNAAAYERNTLSNLRLAFYSLDILKALREQTGIEFGHAARGSLKVFRDPASLDQACAAADRLSREGLNYRRLSRAQTAELEPALAPIASQLAGAIHYVADETGDAYRFCADLADRAQKEGVEFRFGTTVSSLQVSGRRVTAIVCGRERLVADRYIVAAGSYSTPLLRGVGLHLAVQPAKGYSVTFRDEENRLLPRIPIIDAHLHAVVTPLQGAIRVAGTAEFAGFSLELTPSRIQNLLGLLSRVLPQTPFDPAKAQCWCGLRAMSADGVPVIGPTPISNLWVNTGHGHLGWTMAAGSGQLLADLTCATEPGIDAAPYAFR